MTANELRELADKLVDPSDTLFKFHMDQAAAYLRACADALDVGPVAWREELRGDGSHGIPVSEWRVYGITQSKREADAHIRRCTDGIEGRAVPLYKVALPAPPTPPHECKTEAEKRAYAFGWWKAMETRKPREVKMPEPMTPETVHQLAADASVFGDPDELSGDAVGRFARAIEAETLRRVKEANE